MNDDMNTKTVPYSARRGDWTADRESILTVWRNVEAEGLKDNKLQRFYLDNPQGVGEIYLLRSEAESRDVGTLCTARRDFQIGSNVYSGLLFTDLFVEPSHRSLFPSLLLQRKAKDDALQRYDFIFGFMNPVGALVGKQAGYKICEEIEELATPISTHHVISKRLPPVVSHAVALALNIVIRSFIWLSAAIARVRYSVVTPEVKAIDHIWSKASRPGVLLGIRNARFVNWRFPEGPGKGHSLFVINDRSKSAVAYLAFERGDQGKLFIRDALATELPAFKALIRLFVQRAAHAGARTVLIDINPGSDESRWLKARGFLKLGSKPVFLERRGEIAESANYNSVYLTRADNDV